MSLPGNGKYVVRGEMNLMITALRRGAVRWSSNHSSDEETDSVLKQFVELKKTLNNIDDLREIHPNVFLNPFLELIRTDQTTGAVTSLALVAVNKFLSYGLIDPTHPNLPIIVENIADAVTHARFMGTDQASDGVTLLRVVQVLHTLIKSPEGNALTNESVCEFMLSCFKICFEPRLNDLLRKTAEQALKDMVLLLFMRLPQFSPDSVITSPNTATSAKLKKFQMMATKSLDKKEPPKRKISPPVVSVAESSPQTSSTSATTSETSNLLGVKRQVLATTPTTPAGNILDMQGKITQTPTTTREVEAKDESSVPSQVQEATVQEEGDDTEEKDAEGDYVNSVGIRFTQQESIDLETLSSNTESLLIPYGLPCIQELFKFLILLCNPLDKQNSDIMIHIGLNLLTVAFEVAAENIGKYDGLLALVKDELCRNLFALMSTERTSIFATNLHLCFLIFESLRHHLKFQMEMYFLKLSEIITSDNPKLPYEMREISLDNIVQLWRIPGFVAELYVNYDCDLYASNLFEDLTKLMSKNTLSAANSIYSTHILSLDALLSVIENVEKNCIENDDRQASSVVTNPVSSSYGYGTHSRNNSSISEIIIEDGTNKTSISAIHVPVETIENISSFMAKSSPETKCTLPKEILLETKKRKQVITQGTEFFNQKPDKGILYLQENGILNSTLDPMEVASFLRENPGLDKKQIGEFITKKKSEEAGILEYFVKSFNFTNLRIDSALRLYLETFRLPGEAPLIFKVMEHFSEHWHIQNGEPFANPDAAFRLAYAIIMLNMDQHNTNAKKLNVPMTPEDFQKNLRGLNGNNDFDPEMLLEIYNSIKNEEIIMPAEQTGLVKENFLWKVLLRRGLTTEGIYHHIPDATFDKEVFKVIWGPSLAALSFMNDKSTEIGYQRTLKGFIDCAGITAHYKLNEDFDALVLTLCKFTNLLGLQLDVSNELQTAINFGLNPKSQSSLKAVFMLIHKYGDQVVMKESWKNILDVILQLFRLKFLPDSIVKVDDFCIEGSEKKSSLILYKRVQKSEAGIFSSLYSYLSSEGQREPTFEEQKFLDKAKKCVTKCQIESMFEDTKFIRKESLNELLKVLLSWIEPPESHKTVDLIYAEDLVVFWMEILVKVVTQNRDRILPHWESIRDKIYNLILSSASYGYEYLLNRSIIAVFKLVIDLMRNEELCSVVLQSLRTLLLLKSNLIQHVSKQISTGVYELLNKSMYVIHDECDWQIIFTLLEVVGAGAIPPEWSNGNEELDVAGGAKSDGAISSEDESTFPDRGYISDSEIQQSKQKPNQPSANGENWIMVSNSSSPRSQSPTPIGNDLTYPCNLSNHRPYALFKCGESLSLIVRSPVHITPHNFEALVRCMRIFVESSMNGGIKEREKFSNNQRNVRTKENEGDSSLEQRYVGLSIQILDLLYLLYTYTAKMFTKWDNVPCSILWAKGWRPLLQGISRFIMDHRESVRYYAISSLQQKALLFHDIQTLSGSEWEDCFRHVLFPLLNEHLPESTSIKNLNQKLLEDSRSRVATIMSKTFLHHLTPLIKLPNFNELWLRILDYVDKFMKIGSDVLHEQMLETLKNILLVMHSVGVFHFVDGSSGYTPLWSLTWSRINEFLPNLKDELFKEEPSAEVDTNGIANVIPNNIDVIKQQVIEPQVVFPNSPKKESILLQQDDGTNTNSLITPVPIPVILP